MPRRSRCALAFALVAGACLAACGERANTQSPTQRAPLTHVPSPSPETARPVPPSQPTPAGAGGGGPTYTFHVNLGGADPLQGSLSLAAGTGGCGFPAGFAGTIAGSDVAFSINNRSVLAGQAVSLSPGDIVVQVGADVWNVGSSANAPQGTTGTLVHQPDGSGSATFAHLYLVSNPMRTPQESGSITWTCG